MIKFIILSSLSVLLQIPLSDALECYVCHNQEANDGKCLKTIKTCEYGDDVCLTEISWGSTPYWQQGALKQFYVSKSCSTQAKCKKQRKNNMSLCTRIWYEDWKCTECCKGDRCNYFVISKAAKNSLTKMHFILSLSASLIILYHLFYN